MEIDPAFAFELIPGLSVGGSVRVIRVSSNLKGKDFPPGVLGPITVTLDDLSVDGWGIAGAFGVFYKPNNYFSFGTNWRSKAVIGVDGTITTTPGGTQTARYDQTLPMLITAGIGLFPTDHLSIGVSYDFEKNSEICTLTVTIGGSSTAPIP